MDVEPRSDGRRVPDPLVALALALGLALLYRALFQDRMLDDGAGLASMFAEGKAFAQHLLYLPACRLVALVTVGGDPIGPTKLLSALAAGGGCGLCYLLARRLGAERFGALVATLLLAFSPALSFFGTTVEVHALHLAAVAAAAWVTLAAPWERPAVALTLTAAAFALAFLAHQLVVLLGPGWVLLVQLARSRRAAPFAPRTMLLVVGPVLVLALVGALTLSNFLRTGSPVPSTAGELDVLATFKRPPEATWFYWDGWLRPLLVLLPAAALGAIAPASDRLRLGALLALVLVPTAFLFSWGVAERGGYLLGHAPFLVALAAPVLGRFDRRRAVLCAALLFAQAGFAWHVVADFDRGWKVEQRVELVSELLGEEGLFVSTVGNAPRIGIYLPEVRETSLWDVVVDAYREGLSPEGFVAWYLPQAEVQLAAEGRILLDLGFRGQEDRAVVARRLPYYRALISAIEERFTTEEHDHPFWPMLVVRP